MSVESRRSQLSLFEIGQLWSWRSISRPRMSKELLTKVAQQPQARRGQDACCLRLSSFSITLHNPSTVRFYALRFDLGQSHLSKCANKIKQHMTNKHKKGLVAGQVECECEERGGLERAADRLEGTPGCDAQVHVLWPGIVTRNNVRY